jgi:hypothetical protein
MSSYRYFQTFGKVVRLLTLASAVALTVTSLSNAQTCTGHCTRMYLICHIEPNNGSYQMPLSWQTCGAQLEACDARCSEEPTQVDLDVRSRSLRECERHCTMMYVSTGADFPVAACTAMCN